MGQVLKDQAQGNPELWKPRTFNQVRLPHKTFSNSKISNSKKNLDIRNCSCNGVSMGLYSFLPESNKFTFPIFEEKTSKSCLR